MRIAFIQRIIDKIRRKKRNNINNASGCNVAKILETILYYIPESKIIRPFVYSPMETIRELQNSNKSFARFGDGELALINKDGIPFQEYNEDLSKKLLSVLNSNDKNLMVGINYDYFYPHEYNPITMSALEINFYVENVPDCRRTLLKVIDLQKRYYCADFYIGKNKEELFKECRKIWDNKEIVIVNCKNALTNIKYNIYDNAKQIDYIYIPNKNCYAKTEVVFNEIEKYEKNKLIILQAGPAAKIWASELNQKGYRALDLGHLQKQYDYFKKDIDMSKTENIFKMYAPD